MLSRLVGIAVEAAFEHGFHFVLGADEGRGEEGFGPPMLAAAASRLRDSPLEQLAHLPVNIPALCLQDEALAVLGELQEARAVGARAKALLDAIDALAIRLDGQLHSRRLVVVPVDEVAMGGGAVGQQ